MNKLLRTILLMGMAILSSLYIFADERDEFCDICYNEDYDKRFYSEGMRFMEVSSTTCKVDDLDRKYSGSLTIPANVFFKGRKLSVIAIGSISGCLNLTAVNIPQSVRFICDGAFEECENLLSVNIPSSVTSIGRSAFYRCYNLTSINIPSSVTKLGHGAFNMCKKLTSVTLSSSLTTIENGTFRGCALTSIDIPSSVTTIEEEAFAGCRFTAIEIPPSVTSIGWRAFAGCALTSIDIPPSVTSIGSEAFANCRNLTSASIPASTQILGPSENLIENIYLLFDRCEKLKFVKYGDSLISLENRHEKLPQQEVNDSWEVHPEIDRIVDYNQVEPDSVAPSVPW